MFDFESSYKYLWAVLHKAKKNKIEEHKIKFLLAEKNLSPYIEINDRFINYNDLDSLNIEVNGYARFNNIFGNEKTEENENLSLKTIKEKIYNIIFHFLTHLDFLDGLNSRDILLKNILLEIKKGTLGETVRKRILYLNKKEKLAIAVLLQDLYEFDSSLSLFVKAIKTLFSDSLVYSNRYEKKTLLVYLNYEKNKQNKEKLMLIEELFAPIGFKIKKSFKNHPFVLNIPETMELGSGEIH